MKSPTFIAGTALLCAVVTGGCAGDLTPPSEVKRVFGGVGMGRGEFHYPRGLAASPVDGRLFIVDKAARIQRFAPDGTYETEWRMPEWEQGKPTGLCVDQQNRVWVADTHYHRVIVFDRDGRELRRFGERGEGPGQFIWPTNLAIDGEGFVYVGEYGGNDRILKFTPEGKFVLSFAHGEPEKGGTSRPQGLAFDGDGILWVADACNHRIARYTRTGEFLGAFGSLGDGTGQFRFPYEIVVLANNTLVVCDYGNDRLVHMSRDGRTLATWGGTGREPGKLVHPWSMDLGPDKNLYVLDSWNNRVQVLEWR